MLNFKTWMLTEARSRSFFGKLQKHYPNIPNYVAKDAWLNQSRGNIIKDKEEFEKASPGSNFGMDKMKFLRTGWDILNNKKWKLQVIDLHWNILTPRTQEIFLKRKLGAINPFEVSNDEKRFAQQRKTLSKVAEGENEPVIMFYENGKYDLEEGFHRTMTYLLSGGKDDPQQLLNKLKNYNDNEIINLLKSFHPVKLKVWVGY